MPELSRRALLSSLAASSFLALSRPAQATLVRGLSLAELVGRSSCVVQLTAREAVSHYVMLGGRRSIVTDTRVQVEATLAKGATLPTELDVRTLGGVVDGVGELVHGQAQLELGEPSVGFLVDAGGVHWVTGMAQGHYPLRFEPGRDALLEASRNLPTIRDWEASAVRQLAGQSLTSARRLLRELSR